MMPEVTEHSRFLVGPHIVRVMKRIDSDDLMLLLPASLRSDRTHLRWLNDRHAPYGVVAEAP